MSSPFTVVVTGGREWTSFVRVEKAFDTFLPSNTPIQLVHGGCRGLDTIAGIIAKQRGYTVIQENADWNTYGKRAGPIRNERMINHFNPDLVLWFHDDIASSLGTKQCIAYAEKKKILTVCGSAF